MKSESRASAPSLKCVSRRVTPLVSWRMLRFVTSQGKGRWHFIAI